MSIQVGWMPVGRTSFVRGTNSVGGTSLLVATSISLAPIPIVTPVGGTSSAGRDITDPHTNLTCYDNIQDDQHVAGRHIDLRWCLFRIVALFSGRDQQVGPSYDEYSHLRSSHR